MTRQESVDTDIYFKVKNHHIENQISLVKLNIMLDKIYADFEDLCEGLVLMPKGVETHEYSDYKNNKEQNAKSN